MSEERKKIRFIREEPWIAQTLRTFRPIGIIPEEIHTWVFDWLEDIGATMRSREMMVGFLASMGYYAIGVGLISLLESTGVMQSIVKTIRSIVRV